MDALIGFRLPEFVLGLSVLLVDGVESVDGNLRELGTASGNLVA